MTETLLLPAPTGRRTVTPVAVLAGLLLIAASIALGFGIRTWTEPTTRSTAPATIRVIQPATPATPQPLLRVSGPR